MRTRTLALAIAGTAVVGIAAGTLATVALTPAPSTPVCATEDSNGCYWDAETMGNGEGENYYVDPQGTVYYAYNEHCDELASTILANEGMMLTAWESGTPYAPEFRADNYDVLADQLAACN